MTDLLKPWRVLLLSAGYGNETLRDVALTSIRGLGFEASVYDRPGYPVDSSVHSHAACIEAIEQHDIVVAIVDEKEGGQFQIDELPAGLRSRLVELGVIDASYEARPIPSILQAEILTAQRTGKPVIVLVPEATRDVCHTILQQLPRLVGSLTPRRADVVPADALISSRDWRALHDSYDVQLDGITFGQIVFLEQIRRETPNYVSYFPVGRNDELTAHLLARIAALPVTIARMNFDRAHSRMLRKRSPVAASDSLAQLREQGLIVSGPYVSDSSSRTLEPLLAEGKSLVLPRHLSAGTSVALLGDPGMGKSTYLLLAIVDVFDTWTERSPNLLFAWWRELQRDAQRSSADDLMRTLIGLAAGRRSWPAELPLPAVDWQIVLDGIDESDVDLPSLRPLLRDLRGYGAVIVTCREHDFERRLSSIQESFEEIIRLQPWDSDEIQQYKAALSARGDEATAAYIEAHEEDYRGVLSVPLWLTMITFLNRRSGSHLDATTPSDYGLLTQCARAVAEDELRRIQRESDTKPEILLGSWQKAAWAIYSSRRTGDPVRADRLQRDLGLDSAIWSACLSMLDERNGAIAGFVHEIFLEFWLAEYIVGAMLPENRASDRLVSALSLQRSVTTNRLVRQGIAHSGMTADAAAGLREAFWQVSDSETFTKNQILYLLGRVDNSPACVRFLVSVWQNQAEAEFVRYSAAYAAVMLGVHSVEDEFYAALRTNDTFDRMNRWYHRFYYGDLQADERSEPGLDDGTGSADRAMAQLVSRLSRTQPRHLYLRRVELLTLRQFVVTRGVRSIEAEVATLLAKLDEEASQVEDRPGFAAGMREEIALIRAAFEVKTD